MNILKFLIPVLFFSSTSNAITSRSTQDIFETLVHSAQPGLKIKAPMTIEAGNIECGIGAKSMYHCKAEFLVKGEKVIKEIKNSDQFFNYLKHFNAIALDEILIGGNRFVAEKITCTYDLATGTYYRCKSRVSVKF